MSNIWIVGKQQHETFYLLIHTTPCKCAHLGVQCTQTMIGANIKVSFPTDFGSITSVKNLPFPLPCALMRAPCIWSEPKNDCGWMFYISGSWQSNAGPPILVGIIKIFDKIYICRGFRVSVKKICRFISIWFTFISSGLRSKNLDRPLYRGWHIRSDVNLKPFIWRFLKIYDDILK